MKGWQIFIHSLRQVTGNFQGAMRVSGVLYLVQIAVGLLLLGGMSMMVGGPAYMMQQGGGIGIGALLVLIITVVSGLWIAVAWHRFVLLGEMPSALPTFRGDLMWAYFLRSLGLTVIMIVGGAIWGGIVGFALSWLVSSAMILFVVLMAILVYIPILVVGFRIAAVLPAKALGVEKPFMAGWNATAGHLPDLISLAVVLVVIGGALGLAGTYVFAGIPVLYLIWEVVMGWLQMMVGVSILTTLYGHYIEGRALV